MVQRLPHSKSGWGWGAEPGKWRNFQLANSGLAETGWDGTSCFCCCSGVRSKERSPGEQREKITQPRAVKREEEITVRGETGATRDASGAEGEENLSPASTEFFGPSIASRSCKAVPSALNIAPTPSFLPKLMFVCCRTRNPLQRVPSGKQVLGNLFSALCRHLLAPLWNSLLICLLFS